MTGAISDRVVEAQDIAHFAARFLVERYPDRLLERYKLDELPEGEEALLEAIGRRRGYLRKGGVVDLERASNALLKDLSSGGLGRLSLETPGGLQGGGGRGAGRRSYFFFHLTLRGRFAAHSSASAASSASFWGSVVGSICR